MGPWAWGTLGLLGLGAGALWGGLGRPATPLGPCPDGTSASRVPAPSGAQAWCERSREGGAPGRHGPFAAWYPSGRVKIEGRYRDGIAEGRWVYWHDNGRKSEEGNLVAGRPADHWRRWHPNGALRETGSYQDGVREGRWTFWSASGRREREGDYRSGVPVEPWQRWNLKGEACAAAPHEPQGWPLRSGSARPRDAR